MSARDNDGYSTDPNVVLSFTLTVTTYSWTLSLTTISDMQYLVGNPDETQTLGACSTSYLGPTSLSYSAQLADPLPLPSNGISFDAVSRILTVSTSDQINDGLYSVQFTCTDSVNSVSQTMTFDIEIFYIVLTPPTLDSVLNYNV